MVTVSCKDKEDQSLREESSITTVDETKLEEDNETVQDEETNKEEIDNNDEILDKEEQEEMTEEIIVLEPDEIGFKNREQSTSSTWESYVLEAARNQQFSNDIESIKYIGASDHGLFFAKMNSQSSIVLTEIYKDYINNSYDSILSINKSEQYIDIKAEFSDVFLADVITLLTDERVRVFSNRGELIYEQTIPEFITEKSRSETESDGELVTKGFFGFDISRDFKSIVYSDEEGLQLYSYESSETKLLASPVKGDPRFTQFDYFLNPGFVDDDNVIAMISGWEWSNGVVFYNNSKDKVEVIDYVTSVYKILKHEGQEYFYVADESNHGESVNNHGDSFLLNLSDGTRLEVPDTLSKYSLVNELGEDFLHQFTSRGYYSTSHHRQLEYFELNGEKVELFGSDDIESLIPVADYFDDEGNLIALVNYKTIGQRSGFVLWNVSKYNKNISNETSDTLEVEIHENSIIDEVVIELEEDGDYEITYYSTDTHTYIGLAYYDKNRFVIGKIPLGGNEVIWSDLPLEVYEDYGNFNMSIKNATTMRLTNALSYCDYNLETGVISNSGVIDIPEALAVVMFDLETYLYTNDSYELIYHHNGVDKVIYKGYFQEAIGGSGYWISVPGAMEFSKDGSLFSYYIYGYEWNNGPYVYNEEGESVYIPHGLGGDYLSGSWLDNSRYHIEQLVFAGAYFGTLDFAENKFEKILISNPQFVGKVNNNRRVCTSFSSNYEAENVEYYFETDKENNEYVRLVLKKTEASRRGMSSAENYVIKDGILYQYDAFNNKIRIKAYKYNENEVMKPIIDVTDIHQEVEDKIYINGLYVTPTTYGLDYYFLTDYSGYKYLASFTYEEVRANLPYFQESYDEYDVINFNNLIIFDAPTGNIIEEDILDQAHDGNEYDIMAADFDGSNIIYISRMDLNNQYIYSILHKKFVDDSFTLVDSYKVSKEDDLGDLTLLLAGDDKFYYDYYDEENESFEIRQSRLGVNKIFKEDAKNIRYNNSNNEVTYFDTNLNIFMKALSVNHSYNPVYVDSVKMAIEGGYIEQELLDDGTIEFSVTADIYGKENITKTFNSGQDIFIDGSVLYKLIRLRFIHWTSPTEYEVIIKDFEIEF